MLESDPDPIFPRVHAALRLNNHLTWHQACSSVRAAGSALKLLQAQYGVLHRDLAPTTCTQTRRVHLAVIGSGPAGFYAADSALHALPKAGIDVRVDLYEKLPGIDCALLLGIIAYNMQCRLVWSDLA